jgi:hypothetical protein
VFASRDGYLSIVQSPVLKVGQPLVGMKDGVKLSCDTFFNNTDKSEYSVTKRDVYSD